MSSHRHTHTHYTTVKTNSGHLGQASSKLKHRGCREWQIVGIVEMREEENYREYYILIKRTTKIHMTVASTSASVMFVKVL